MICTRKIAASKLKFHLKSIFVVQFSLMRISSFTVAYLCVFFFQNGVNALVESWRCWFFSYGIEGFWVERRPFMRSWLFSKIWQIKTINYLRNNFIAVLSLCWRYFSTSDRCIGSQIERDRDTYDGEHKCFVTIGFVQCICIVVFDQNNS